MVGLDGRWRGAAVGRLGGAGSGAAGRRRQWGGWEAPAVGPAAEAPAVGRLGGAGSGPACTAGPRD